MEIPTKQDFDNFTTSIASQLREIKELLSEKNVNQPVLSWVMTVKEVTEQFKCSEYTQRVARLNGDLPWTKVGKDIHYQREDVQNWLKSKRIKI